MSEENHTWRNPQQICLINEGKGEIVAWGYDRDILQAVADWLNSDGENFVVRDGFADRQVVPAVYTWLEGLGQLDEFYGWYSDQ